MVGGQPLVGSPLAPKLDARSERLIFRKRKQTHGIAAFAFAASLAAALFAWLGIFAGGVYWQVPATKNS
jgi:hypothetical protein